LNELVVITEWLKEHHIAQTLSTTTIAQLLTRFRFENVPYGLTKLKENCHKLKNLKGGQ